MQVLKEKIRERIRKSAIDVFFAKGFYKATMKEIALKAKVPTGLLYSYYENKEALLDCIITPLSKDTKKMLEKEHGDLENGFEFFFNSELPEILEKIIFRRKEMIIAYDKCSGTKYENFKNDIIKDIAGHIKRHFMKKHKESDILFDDLFFHIVAHNFSEGFFEIARHYKNEDWARKMLYLLSRQQMYGMAGV